MNLHEKLKRTPHEPGVYLMKGADQVVLYVGKAKDLRARLNSYFVNANQDSIKTAALVAEVAEFDVILVHNEVEALLLERTLIKHHEPPYNVLWRDDKSYPYVRIDVQNPWPRLRKVRRRKDDGAIYLGPYTNVGQLNVMLDMVFSVFPLVRCSEHEFANASRPCNYYHMKRCLGPCSLAVDPAVYHGIVEDAINLMQGKNKEVVRTLKAKMKAAAEAEHYELAATFRDQIEAYAVATQNQAVIIGARESLDVVGAMTREGELGLHILTVRAGKLLGTTDFSSKTPMHTPPEAIAQVLLQYYEKNIPPPEVVLPFPIAEQETLEHLLQDVHQTKTRFLIPKKGRKRKLMEMANRNADHALAEQHVHEDLAQQSLHVLQRILGLPQLPRRIECIDISNIQNTAIVASDVCFMDGRPEKRLYRLYNIADKAEHADDFASIHLVMQRRLRRAQREHDLADLFVIDGGKGQLNAALEAAAGFPELRTTIVGLAKSRLEGDQRSSERIFVAGSDEPLELALGSPEYRLLTHLRDEAHRFALRQHRRRRRKVLQGSWLEGIAGIGPALRKKLLAIFFDLDGIKRASLEDLKRVPGLSAKAVEALYLKTQELLRKE